MKNLLHELWEVYRADHPFLESEEEKNLMARLEECEAALDSLNGEQRKTVNEIQSCWEELCRIAERDAFREGVRFAAMLWNEVFSQGSKAP